ncbi:MAG: glutamine--fructose-6-phosphate aminotransferase [Betaproteobacteria bacterium RIFCSPLOWO2_02_FULL_67_26]|nr:MAG: glutamine--fructose-6-phosphate aminotransferase [Betaproteobacteria bacterium RIFCSPLOWO2_02_FULL_67_26]
MCGIVGAASTRNVVDLLIEGIRKLEYRGYDSTGIAFVTDGRLERLRSTGRVAHLDELARERRVEANTGLSHTRWATHGAPTEANAHPHFSARDGLEIGVVHNGIVENHEPIRARMKALGYGFSSETDTEVMAHHVHSLVAGGRSLFESVKTASREWQGAYAVGFVCSREPEVVVGARQGSPLLVGLGRGENFLASDASALVTRTREVIYLEEGDVVEVRPQGVTICAGDGRPVERAVTRSELSADAIDKGPYAHYMQKEIFEQPGAVANTLEMVANAQSLVPNLFGAEASDIFGRTKQVLLLACGTSFHAGLVARYWLEAVAGLPATVEIASEFRYRDPVVQPGTLVVTISQSGETADTLAALKHAQARGIADSLTICNAPESSLMRASRLRFLTRAGPEIGVASTKAFTTQLAALFVLTLVLAKLKRRLAPGREAELITQLRHLPRAMESVLAVEPQVRDWARRFQAKHHALFLGRGVHFPIAMEGALKLKEVSYIHAEAYAAGELKHGPLALVDADMPVVTVAPNDQLLEKLKSNMHEVRARGGELYVFADRDARVAESEGVRVIRLMDHAGPLSPILHVVPLQLLAYHVAVLRGTDVDKPRNLAKSVTVE